MGRGMSVPDLGVGGGKQRKASSASSRPSGSRGGSINKSHHQGKRYSAAERSSPARDAPVPEWPEGLRSALAIHG